MADSKIDRAAALALLDVSDRSSSVIVRKRQEVAAPTQDVYVREASYGPGACTLGSRAILPTGLASPRGMLQNGGGVLSHGSHQPIEFLPRSKLPYTVSLHGTSSRWRTSGLAFDAYHLFLKPS